MICEEKNTNIAPEIERYQYLYDFYFPSYMFVRINIQTLSI